MSSLSPGRRRSLRILEVADNGLTRVGQLAYLGRLESLVLTGVASLRTPRLIHLSIPRF